MKLSDLKNGQTTYVANITGSRTFCLRLEAMGFVPGQEVTRLYAALPGSPIVFGMLGQKVALRRSTSIAHGSRNSRSYNGRQMQWCTLHRLYGMRPYNKESIP